MSEQSAKIRVQESGGQKTDGQKTDGQKTDGAEAAGSVLESGAASEEKKPEATPKVLESGAASEEKKPEATPNVLESGAASEEKKPETGEKKAENAEPGAVTPEQAAEYAGKIKPVDLGAGADGQPIAWDAEGVAAVAGVFAKHKIPESVANEAVAAYAEHMKAQYQAVILQETELYKRMAGECAARFGNDLPRVAKAAYRGGTDIFGAELFRQLAGVPAFANDARIIEALAARGRAVADDPGVSAPGGAGAPKSDLVSRLYPPGSLGKK